MNRGASGYAYFDQPFACLAHRGGYVTASGDEGRENSLYAFAKAVEFGYRYLETDVHVTADGRLIAFHDTVLDRVTDAHGRISELPFDAVREARIDGRDPIPTLDEVLESFPDTRINIDIKAPGAIEPLAQALRHHHAERRVCVASFSGSRLGRFRRITRGAVATSAPTPTVAWSAFVPQLPRWINTPGQAFQVPFAQQVAGRTIRVVNRRLMQVARARDMRVHVWTINDADQMHRLIDLGVDGLITDRIDVLKQVAQEHGLWDR
ncbi:glycerophosphodiester phosphodiesterase [Brooklawnia cerclae]|uniref:Glycerophosphoryl diester phosphodiesterase n=1 Tax=Brooklawnia cerclae TaxID=349934 RepID=A0ABX0SEE2_9ACTN|nr:glycerophosphoryl diester phosphodiesterase [Brooklawnia cerclae]